MFKTPYAEHERVYITSGTPIQNIYKHEINKKGLKELVKTGETNLYEKIQEAAEDVKIENILNRVMQGDTSMLRANGQYVDTTEIPSNMIEARKAIQKLENTWDELPAETKREYDFSIEKFINEAGSTKWMEDMGLIKKTEIIPEVKETATAKGENEE